MEAKRKKAEEEGLEPVPELPEDALREMTDEQLAAHLAGTAGTNPDQDGSVCQSEESNPTNSSSTNPVTNNNPTTACLENETSEIKTEVDHLTPSDRSDR